MLDKAIAIPDNIYPARGRKQRKKEMIKVYGKKFPTIFTPQGDGNTVKFCKA